MYIHSLSLKSRIIIVSIIVRPYQKFDRNQEQCFNLRAYFSYIFLATEIITSEIRDFWDIPYLYIMYYIIIIIYLTDTHIKMYGYYTYNIIVWRYCVIKTWWRALVGRCDLWPDYKIYPWRVIATTILKDDVRKYYIIYLRSTYGVLLRIIRW